MSDMRKLLESMDKFAGEPAQKPGKKHSFDNHLIGEDVEQFAQELMLEYHKFVVLPEDDIPGNPSSPVANINPAGQGTQANTAANASAGTSTVQPMNQQPNPAQQAAMKQKEQGDLTKNIASLKTLDPTLDVGKIQQALSKDPKLASPADNQQLGQLANTLEPVFANPQAMSSLRGKIQQLTPKV